MTCSQICTVFGLVLDIAGVGIIMWRSAIRYLSSWFSEKSKNDIEDEALKIGYGRHAPDTREEMLMDSHVRGFIATFATSFWGFVLIILGFVFQLFGALLK